MWRWNDWRGHRLCICTLLILHQTLSGNETVSCSSNPASGVFLLSMFEVCDHVHNALLLIIIIILLILKKSPLRLQTESLQQKREGKKKKRVNKEVKLDFLQYESLSTGSGSDDINRHAVSQT